MTTTTNDIRNYTAKQVIKMLKEEGSLTLRDETDIDILIKFYPNRSIDTSDLYTIIDDLNDDNKEVIALILDYIKRIRPAERAKDEKEELKNVTNELKNLATELDIPVISAHQLNRDGASKVDAAIESNKEDLARFVGRSNVGSAWEICLFCLIIIVILYYKLF
jgi:replicative DNA helicase